VRDGQRGRQGGRAERDEQRARRLDGSAQDRPHADADEVLVDRGRQHQRAGQPVLGRERENEHEAGGDRERAAEPPWLCHAQTQPLK
jgi:hypothetical protein